MQLKTYQAKSMREVMRLVRDELGDEAVIISTVEDGGLARATAALERPDPDPDPDPGPFPDPGPATPPDTMTNAGADADAGAGRIAAMLDYHGVTTSLSDRLIQRADAAGSDDPGLALAAALDQTFRFAPIPDRDLARPLMLVGPPGAGKTTIAAKIAAQAAMAGEPVSLISTDTVRAGAIEQLAAYARVMEQDLATAERPEELGALLRLARGQNLILIDTPGANPFSEDEMADARRFLCAEEIMPILVLPAGLDAADAADSARIFAGLGCRRLIVTRLDVTRRYGALLAAADAGEMAICGASISSSIAHGMKSLSPVGLARLLLRDPTQAHGDEAGDGPYEFEDEA